MNLNRQKVNMDINCCVPQVPELERCLSVSIGQKPREGWIGPPKQTNPVGQSCAPSVFINDFQEDRNPNRLNR